MNTTSNEEGKRATDADVKFIVEEKQKKYVNGILEESPYKVYAKVDNVVVDGVSKTVKTYNTNTTLPSSTNNGIPILDGLYLK